jgi:tetratricopeptide (TPR) repeat protein
LSPWAKLNIAGIQAARARNYALTERCFQAAEKAAMKNKDEYRQEIALINLAGAYALEVKPNEQKKALLQLIEQEKANGESYDIPRRLLQLAQLEGDRSEISGCRQLAFQAVEAAQKEYGENSLSTVQVVNDAWLMVKGAPDPQIIGLLEQLANLQERHHLPMKSTLLTLCYNYTLMNNPGKIEAYAHRLKPMLKEGSPDLAELYIAQTVAALELGDKAKAKDLIAHFCQTIDEFQKTTGREVKPSIREELAGRLVALGEALLTYSYSDKNDIDAIFKRALEISNGRGIGRNGVPGIYGAILAKTGREPEVISLARRYVTPELSDAEPFASLEGVAICNNVARVYKGKNDLPKAIVWGKRGLDACLAMKNSPDFHDFQVVQTGSPLANNYIENNQLADAEKVLKLCLQYHREFPAFGNLGTLAEVQFKQGKYKEAETNFRLALQAGAGSSAAVSYRRGIEQCIAAQEKSSNSSALGASASSGR